MSSESDFEENSTNSRRPVQLPSGGELVNVLFSNPSTDRATWAEAFVAFVNFRLNYVRLTHVDNFEEADAERLASSFRGIADRTNGLTTFVFRDRAAVSRARLSELLQGISNLVNSHYALLSTEGVRTSPYDRASLNNEIWSIFNATRGGRPSPTTRGRLNAFKAAVLTFARWLSGSLALECYLEPLDIANCASSLEAADPRDWTKSSYTADDSEYESKLRRRFEEIHRMNHGRMLERKAREDEALLAASRQPDGFFDHNTESLLGGSPGYRQAMLAQRDVVLRSWKAGGPATQFAFAHLVVLEAETLTEENLVVTAVTYASEYTELLNRAISMGGLPAEEFPELFSMFEDALKILLAIAVRHPDEAVAALFAFEETTQEAQLAGLAKVAEGVVRQTKPDFEVPAAPERFSLRPLTWEDNPNSIYME